MITATPSTASQRPKPVPASGSADRGATSLRGTGDCEAAATGATDACSGADAAPATLALLAGGGEPSRVAANGAGDAIGDAIGAGGGGGGAADARLPARACGAEPASGVAVADSLDGVRESWPAFGAGEPISVWA